MLENNKIEKIEESEEKRPTNFSENSGVQKITKHIPILKKNDLNNLRHPMDPINGAGCSPISKQTDNKYIEEYKFGIIFNSYFLKICRLDPS